MDLSHENSIIETDSEKVYAILINLVKNAIKFTQKGAITFGEYSLIYSLKKNVFYNNEVLDLSLEIQAEPNDQPLIKGTYFINVFYKDRKLGSTQVLLY